MSKLVLGEEKVKSLTKKTQTDKAEKIFYSAKELQDKLGLGRNATLQLIKTDGFPKLQIGKKYYVPIRQLEDWIISNLNCTIDLKANPKAKEGVADG